MTEREIAYCRDEFTDAVGPCPCCGEEGGGVYACHDCFFDHHSFYEDRRGLALVDIRDAFYDLGVRLRAEGKMPALKHGPAAPAERAKVYGVWRADQAIWCALGYLAGESGAYVDAVSRRDDLLRAFPKTPYEVHEYTDGSPPKGTTDCPECKAAPCDCEKEIWTYWYRLADGDIGKEGPMTRRLAVNLRKTNAIGEIDPCRGPVQRVSDPAWDFGKIVEVKPGVLFGIPISKKPLQGITIVNEAALARALFDEEMLKRASDGGPSEPEQIAERDLCVGGERTKAAVSHVLDVMWAGKDGAGSTKPDVRKRCEGLAAMVCARMGRKA